MILKADAPDGQPQAYCVVTAIVMETTDTTFVLQYLECYNWPPSEKPTPHRVTFPVPKICKPPRLGSSAKIMVPCNFQLVVEPN